MDAQNTPTHDENPRDSLDFCQSYPFPKLPETSISSKKITLASHLENPRPTKKLKAPTILPSWATNPPRSSQNPLTHRNSLIKNKPRTKSKNGSNLNATTHSNPKISCDTSSNLTNSKNTSSDRSETCANTNFNSSFKNDASYSFNSRIQQTYIGGSPLANTRYFPRNIPSTFNFEKARSVFQNRPSNQRNSNSSVNKKVPQYHPPLHGASKSSYNTKKVNKHVILSSNSKSIHPKDSDTSEKNIACIKSSAISSVDSLAVSRQKFRNSSSPTKYSDTNIQVPQYDSQASIPRSLFDKLELMNTRLNSKFDFMKNENQLLQNKIKELNLCNKLLKSSLHKPKENLKSSSAPTLPPEHKITDLYCKVSSLNSWLSKKNRLLPASDLFNHSIKRPELAALRLNHTKPYPSFLDNSSSDLLEDTNKELSKLLFYFEQSESNGISDSTDTILAHELSSLSLYHDTAPSSYKLNNSAHRLQSKSKSSASLKTLRNVAPHITAHIAIEPDTIPNKTIASTGVPTSDVSYTSEALQYNPFSHSKPLSPYNTLNKETTKTCSDCTKHLESVKALLVDNDFYRSDNKNLQKRLQNVTDDFNQLVEIFEGHKSHHS